jgi:signal transduction histidine kinase
MPSEKVIFILIIISTVVIFLLLLSLVYIFSLYSKKQRLFAKELEAIRLNYEKEILQTQLEIQEQTFRDISREIHDNIGLSLTLAKLQLNTLDYQNREKSMEHIESSVELIGKAITDLRDISHSLNSDIIKTNGLYNTLKEETEKIQRSGKQSVNFIVTGDAIFLDAERELVLYRIAQEALNNILKHASATEITLCLHYEVDSLTLSIRDNGKGFEIMKDNLPGPVSVSAGLTNMRIRALSINGSFKIETAPRKGTSIFVKTVYN